MAIEFREEMYFSEIEIDFVAQLKTYVQQNIQISITDIDTNIYKLIRIPRVLINFLIDGFGKDASNNALFINYIQTEYAFLYSSNTDVTELISIPGHRDLAKYEFKKLYKDQKSLANSEKLFLKVDISSELLYKKLDIRLNNRLAFKTGIMISDFIHGYMEAKGIKVLKINPLDSLGNEIKIITTSTSTTDPITNETFITTINPEFIYKRNIFITSAQ